MNNLEKSLRYEEEGSDRVVSFARILDKSGQENSLIERLKENLSIDAFEKDIANESRQESHLDSPAHPSSLHFFLKKLLNFTQTNGGGETHSKRKPQTQKRQGIIKSKKTNGIVKQAKNNSLSHSKGIPDLNSIFKKSPLCYLKELEREENNFTVQHLTVKNKRVENKTIETYVRKAPLRKSLNTNKKFPKSHFVARRNHRSYRDK